jgi:UDP-N-acetylmuramoyl-L-alanyl-D-glutamate--2,6-diaminopimelate ligase
MKLRDLVCKLNIISNNADLDMEISGVCYDTRRLSPGDLFIAIRGHQFDGHLFIDEAVNKGAACIICEEAVALSASVQFIVVEDSRKALALISSAWFLYPSEKLKIIGVTGTNGKTTVTTLIKCIIENCGGGKVGLIGTNANYIGDKEYLTSFTTPESFEIHKLLGAMVDEGCKYVVMEVSSHALSLDRVYGILFEVGVFTNLSPEHLDFHKSMEEYAGAKSLLFSNSRQTAVHADYE